MTVGSTAATGSRANHALYVDVIATLLPAVAGDVSDGEGTARAVVISMSATRRRLDDGGLQTLYKQICSPA